MCHMQATGLIKRSHKKRSNFLIQMNVGLCEQSSGTVCNVKCIQLSICMREKNVFQTNLELLCMFMFSYVSPSGASIVPEFRLG